jgi:predicted nucleotidyltransferase
MPPPVAKYRIILQTLADNGVEYVVIGGVAASLLGAPIMTLDLDVVHSRTPENLDRLLVALGALDALYREQPARRLRPTLSHLSSPGHQLLMTRAGPLDLLGTITGGRSYEELLQHTVMLDAGDGLRVRVVDLATLIRLKEETGRDKDRAMLPVLRRTLEQQEQDQGDKQ